MSRTIKADQVRDAFLEALRSESASIETMGALAASESYPKIRSLFLALGQQGREVYRIRGIGFINIHIRSETPGWWNILKTVKRDLDLLTKEFKIKCFYVLLIRRDDQFIADGYIVSDFAKSPLVRQPGIEETKYTVNERQHLDVNKKLLSIEKVAKVLMKARSRNAI